MVELVQKVLWLMPVLAVGVLVDVTAIAVAVLLHYLRAPTKTRPATMRRPPVQKMILSPTPGESVPQLLQLLLRFGAA